MAGFLRGVIHDRRLMQEAQVNLEVRRFIACALRETPPDRLSLTRVCQRRGESMFRRISTRVARRRHTSGLVPAETVHIDASLIRANVSMDGLVAPHGRAVADADDAEQDARASGKFKKLSRAELDGTMATSSKAPLRPAYKQHTGVDAIVGVVVDEKTITARSSPTTTMTRPGSPSARNQLKNRLGAS
jgi:hypothetical protein